MIRHIGLISCVLYSRVLFYLLRFGIRLKGFLWRDRLTAASEKIKKQIARFSVGEIFRYE